MFWGAVVLACVVGICGTLLVVKWLAPQEKTERPLVPVVKAEEKKAQSPLDLPEKEPQKANPLPKTVWVILEEKTPELLTEMAKAQRARLEERWRLAFANCDKVIEGQEKQQIIEMQMAKEEFALLSAGDKQRANAIRRALANGVGVDNEDIQFAIGIRALREPLNDRGIHNANKYKAFDKIKRLALHPEKIEWMRAEFGLLEVEYQRFSVEVAKKIAGGRHLEREESQLTQKVRVLRNFRSEFPEPSPYLVPVSEEEFRTIKLRGKRELQEMREATDFVFGLEFAQALSGLDTAIGKDRAIKEAYLLRAALHFLIQNDAAKAKADCQKALAALPTDGWALLIRGLVNLSEGDRTRALSDYQEAIHHNPGLQKYAELFR